MKRVVLHYTVTALHEASMLVPDDITEDEILRLANERIDRNGLPVGVLEEASWEDPVIVEVEKFPDPDTEAVEVCPYCESECMFPDYDVKASGYVTKCTHCGAEILLCDECMHAEDNPAGYCDWHLIGVKDGIEVGGCFRGKTHNPVNIGEFE